MAKMDFTDRAVHYLRLEFPEKTSELPAELLRQRVDEGCAKAVTYGFKSEVDVMGYIDLQWRIAMDFDESEKTFWAREVLNADFLSPEYKITKLRELYATQQALDDGN